MSNLENFTPIVYEHNLASLPIGIVKHEDGKIVFKLNDKAQITEDQINNMNRVFAPTYQITKVDKDGFVKELELIAFSINSNR